MTEDTPDRIAAGQTDHAARPLEAAGGGRAKVHHKPHPIHGWRDFLKEIGIVVIGVLIALAAGQSVEWLNWREKARVADTRLLADARTVLNHMLERLDIQSCQDRRLVQIKDRLLVSGAMWNGMAPFYMKGPPAGSRYAHPMRTWPRTAWENAVASTAANHLPPDRLADYSKIFDAAQREANDQTNEHEDSSQLNLLGSNLTLTPDQKILFLLVIERERARNRVMAYEAHNSISYFGALGVDVEKVRKAAREDSLAYKVCRANGLI